MMRKSPFSWSAWALAVVAALLLRTHAAHGLDATPRHPLQVSDLKTLLPWIAANTIDHCTPEELLDRVERASTEAVQKKHPGTATLPALTHNFENDVAAYGQWLSKAEPDSDARGTVLRDALRNALHSLKEDGTSLHLPHKYLLPPELEGYDKGGIGVLVDHEPDAQGRFIIFETLDGFPAATVGLRAGDRLIGVGDHSVVGLSYRELADLVRGNLGTKVKLTVERSGTPQPLTFELERVWLNPNPKNISWKLLPGGVGYVRVKYLGERMDLEILRVLDKFKQAGVKKIVLDLRNNEGLLDGSLDVGAVFLGNNQEIAKLISHDGTNLRTEGSKSCDLPMAVLVNRYTSGAGVLLAGALADHGRAHLAGEATVWRDQPQVSKELEDGSTVTVTTGYYVLPGGKTLRARNHSLTPPQAIPQDPLKPLGGPDDAQLQKALELLKP